MVKEGGNIETGRGLAREVFESTYLNGYVAHAPMETHTALAEVKDGKATVWASTQSPFGVKEQVAGARGMALANVRVKSVFVGGVLAERAQAGRRWKPLGWLSGLGGPSRLPGAEGRNSFMTPSCPQRL